MGSSDPFSATVAGLPVGASAVEIEDSIITAINGLGLSPCVSIGRIPPPGIHQGRIRLSGPLNDLYFTGPGGSGTFLCNMLEGTVIVPGFPGAMGCSFNPIAFENSSTTTTTGGSAPALSAWGLSILVVCLGSLSFFLRFRRHDANRSAGD